MNAICSCGVLLTAPEDGVFDELRDARSLNELGARLVEHLVKEHPEDWKTIATLSQQFTGWAVMGKFESRDPRFQNAREKGREMFAALFEGSQAKPPIPPGKKVIA